MEPALRYWLHAYSSSSRPKLDSDLCSSCEAWTSSCFNVGSTLTVKNALLPSMHPPDFAPVHYVHKVYLVQLAVKSEFCTGLWKLRHRPRAAEADREKFAKLFDRENRSYAAGARIARFGRVAFQSSALALMTSIMSLYLSLQSYSMSLWDMVAS
jgi:hypothetical protein